MSPLAVTQDIHWTPETEFARGPSMTSTTLANQALIITNQALLWHPPASSALQVSKI